MTSLHHIRVRRSRRLPMPLPPKPKARPLGPPTLFVWKDVPIRVRADIERAGWTWDEFLDDLVAFRSDPRNFREGWLALQAIERLVPSGSRREHVLDVGRRIARQRQVKVQAELAAVREGMGSQRRGVGGDLMGRFFGRHA